MLRNRLWLLAVGASFGLTGAPAWSQLADQPVEKPLKAAVASPLAGHGPASSEQPAAPGKIKEQGQVGQGAQEPPTQAPTISEPAKPKPAAGAPLQSALDAYRDDAQPGRLSQLLSCFAQLIAGLPISQPAQSLAKNIPALAQLGAQALDLGGGRVWLLTKLPQCRQALVDWQESRSTVTYTGKKRHRVKHVHTTTTRRSAWVVLPPDVILNQAHMWSGATDHPLLILVGQENGAGLWLKTFRLINGEFSESASNLDSIPAFLTRNMSGTVGFRGADLLLNVAPVVKEASLGCQRLPEAESCTYRFCLHLSERGYALMRRLPDEEPYDVVKSFMAAIAGNHTDAARLLLTDDKLLSIPKYVGIKRIEPDDKVVQMSSPPSGACRYRLISGGKDDLIFEVVRGKDRQFIRSIFIAKADPFLKDIASELPPAL